MNKTLSEFLAGRVNQKRATEHGTDIHARLQRIVLGVVNAAGMDAGAKTGTGDRGDKELIEKIQKNPEIARFFINTPGRRIQTEVPIAGMVDGQFISRRIDRMIINVGANENSPVNASDSRANFHSPLQTSGLIEFLDYKTDTDRTARRDKYAAQMAEYAALLSAAYPGFDISGSILWLHDWELEKFVQHG